MVAMIHSSFRDAFTPGARFVPDRGGAIDMTTRTIGELALPTGRVGVGDPFTTSFAEPPSALARTASPGRFPVELAIARFDHGDERVACARVRFADAGARATRWETAIFEGEAAPGADEIAGYGVDSGTGCFFDRGERADVDDVPGEEWLAAMEANQVDTWTWHVAPVAEARVVLSVPVGTRALAVVS
jgi:hypothetical protein